jgi:hypothetical protein
MMSMSGENGLQQLQELCDRALARYGVRILDNVDLDRLPDLRSRACVIAHALIERGDARAFVLGRQLLAETGQAVASVLRRATEEPEIMPVPTESGAVTWNC